MSAFALVTGTLWKNPEQRTSSRTGKLFTVATIRAGSDDSVSDFWSITAFSESAQAELLRLSAGDALSAQGKARFELYTSNNGTKISRSIVADAVLPLRPAPRTPKAKAAKAAHDQSTTAATDPPDDLNDPIPF
jgi:single-stranded DNA-binding protein